MADAAGTMKALSSALARNCHGPERQPDRKRIAKRRHRRGFEDFPHDLGRDEVGRREARPCSAWHRPQSGMAGVAETQHQPPSRK
jgi:hypothetical protein